MGNIEVAELLGVCKQRVQLLRKTALWQQYVPNSRRLRMGSVFLADEVRAFQTVWTRKPGRPRKEEHRADVP
jgi:hypothetical protein